ncbi:MULTISPECIES: BREX system Lon protease-like protein BrxL [Methanothermobacter]|uniref:BREX system Lon protease-like protein BrxL n=1 Tax=Methanothermobacter wolfeii TaxID=145261 RepID=A0A9E7RUJ7_METWO|nr:MULTISPECIES: BREX system Lon protease-like protein BrxL [Methanothermobacter]QHN06343.1 BREX system Lon protease-like protein BrxL [Methanothermobacter sp. THM-1]UXH32545.1 BREX system Lon protease-like protein BrxL [Methanothermobacter wolfeii]
MELLDYKIKEEFPVESVLKKPEMYGIFTGYNLPSFVKDWLIQMNTTTEGKLDEHSLKFFLDQHIAQKNKNIKGTLINDLRSLKLLARIIIEPDIKSGILKFAIPDLGIGSNEGVVPNYIAEKYPELKGGEIWGVVKLSYNPPDNGKNGFIEIADYRSFKPYSVDLDYFKEKRGKFTIEEWIDLLIRSMEYNPKGFESLTQKMLFIARLLVFVEPNLNMFELAPKGTGKSYVFNNLSKYGWVISGGIVSRAKLLYDISRKTPGLLTLYDFVAMDEVETIKFTDESELRGALKNYLESGTFSVANYKGESSSGLIVLGNIPLTEEKTPISKKYFTNLHRFFNDPALLDRFHGFIEGWKLPRMREDLIIKGYALNVEYFSEILHELRMESQFRNVVEKMLYIPKDADTRDKKAIIKLATAYLKLIFPHVSGPEDIENQEFKTFCLEPAIKMRSIIKKQISYIDPEFSEEVPDIRVKE